MHVHWKQNGIDKELPHVHLMPQRCYAIFLVIVGKF